LPASSTIALATHLVLCLRTTIHTAHTRRLDEEAGDKWDLPRATIDSLAAGMTVTIFLDFWRLLLPSIEGSALAWKGIPYFD
jgi:hypothetical protein